MENLRNILEKTKKGDEKALLEVIERFNPIIKKYSRELNYPEAETDLIISIIELCRDINLMKFQNEGALVNYFYLTLRSLKIDYFRKNKLKEDLSLNLDVVLTEESDLEQIFIDDILKALPELQRDILTKRIIQGYSDSEIAKMYSITRQAVNRTKNRALCNLKKAL